MSQLDTPIIYSHSSTANTITLNVEHDTHALALRVRYAAETDQIANAGTKNHPAQTNVELGSLPSDAGYFVQVQAVGDGTTYTDSAWSSAVFAATTDSNEARLRSVRRRIDLLREALECPDSLINVSVDGVSESWVNRKDLVVELTALENVEARLSGRTSRIRRIDLSRT